MKKPLTCRSTFFQRVKWTPQPYREFIVLVKGARNKPNWRVWNNKNKRVAGLNHFERVCVQSMCYGHTAILHSAWWGNSNSITSEPVWVWKQTQHLLYGTVLLSDCKYEHVANNNFAILTSTWNWYQIPQVAQKCTVTNIYVALPSKTFFYYIIFCDFIVGASI